MKKESPTKKVTIFLKRHRAPAQVQEALDYIIADLEKYGRTTTKNGKASRYLSFRMRQQKNNDKIFFTWNRKNQSIITLNTETRLEKISNNKIRLIYEGHLKKKDK